MRRCPDERQSASLNISPEGGTCRRLLQFNPDGLSSVHAEGTVIDDDEMVLALVQRIWSLEGFEP